MEAARKRSSALRRCAQYHAGGWGTGLIAPMFCGVITALTWNKRRSKRRMGNSPLWGESKPPQRFSWRTSCTPPCGGCAVHLRSCSGGEGETRGNVEVAEPGASGLVVRRSKDVASFPLTEKLRCARFFDSPQASRAAEPPRIRGRNKSPASCFNAEYSPLGESQICASRFGEGETGDKVGVEMFPAGLT